MIASTQTINTKFFAFIAVLVFKLLSRKIVYTQKRQKKLKKYSTFKYLDTLETRKRSLVSAFSICMPVPLILHLNCIHYFSSENYGGP